MSEGTLKLTPKNHDKAKGLHNPTAKSAKYQRVTEQYHFCYFLFFCMNHSTFNLYRSHSTFIFDVLKNQQLNVLIL